MIYFRQICFQTEDSSLVHISKTFHFQSEADYWLCKYMDLFSDFSPSFDSSCLDDDRSFLDDDIEYQPILDCFACGDDLEDIT